MVDTPGKTFSDRLMEAIDASQSFVVAGLDPRIDSIPFFFREDPVKKHGPSLKAVGEAIISFNKFIVDIAASRIPAMKPQIAFYEMYGLPGLEAFDETVRYIKAKEMLVIEDAKRNDIGTTAAAYSTGHLGMVQVGGGESEAVFDVDAITVNPYLGSDGVQPFLMDIRAYGKGIFVLVKTSNPSSGELQDLVLEGGERFYEHVARRVNQWGEHLTGQRGYSDVGAVVGATYPRQARELRKMMRRTIFLVPGYGAQGGSARDVIECFGPDGYGAVISSSRGLTYPHKDQTDISPESFEKLVKKAIDDMNNDINEIIRIEKDVGW